MFRYENKKKGISLIELILTIAILSIVIQVVYSIFFVGQKSFSTSKDIGFAQQEARSPLNYIDKELRTSKSVYLNSEPTEYPHYKLSTENNQLIKQTFTSAEAAPTEQVFFSGIKSLVFYPIWIGDKLNDEIEYNMLDMIIESQEGDIIKTYNMTIRFENNQDTGTIKRILNDEGNLKVLEDQYILVYYTKYE